MRAASVEKALQAVVANSAVTGSEAAWPTGSAEKVPCAATPMGSIDSGGLTGRRNPRRRSTRSCESERPLFSRAAGRDDAFHPQIDSEVTVLLVVVSQVSDCYAHLGHFVAPHFNHFVGRGIG